MIEANEARVQVTWAGQQGDLPDPVLYQATEGDIKQWVTEAVRGGDIPGIDAAPEANFQDFVVQRFDAKDGQPNRISIRPKVPFGGQG